MVGVEAVASCGIGQAGEVGEFEADLEEGVPYITGYRETSHHHKYIYISVIALLRWEVKKIKAFVD